jgi:hypothetical protein
MSRVTAAAKAILSDIGHFSRLVIETELYDYQIEPLHAVIDSVFSHAGREFLIIMPRQSGKNEAVAQLLVYLLNLYQRKGGSIVYATAGDGVGRGLARLETRLDNPWNIGRWKKRAGPTRRILGRAQCAFMSAHPTAASRGETADLLLVLDELQDLNASHIEAVFQPMRAATNATAVYIGTVKTTSDALWLKKSELEAAEKKNGQRLVWIIEPEQVINNNPNYAAFLENKIATLGRHHPIVASEYFNEPTDGTGGLFDERRRKLMRGSHQRQTEPTADSIYVATLDVAGQDEAATSAIARLDNPARDYTIATIFEITINSRDPGPTYKARDIFVDHGSRHFQDVPGRPRLVDRLAAWLNHWKIVHLVADASGVGQGMVDWLGAKLSAEVTPVLINPKQKAAIGTGFLSVIETMRFQYWRDEEEIPLSDAWLFWRQAAACTYYIPEDGQMSTDMQWSVPASATIEDPAGKKIPIHDDRLFSAALVAIYDELHAEGKLRAGQAKSRVIPPKDVLKDLTF